MAHPDVIHETYHISHIAEWFHAFPHVDIKFSSVNTTFDPSNSEYLEALGIIIAVPGFYLILTLLAFLIFFLCRCCDSSFKRKRKITPLKWILSLFAILCCGALAVGLYGNDTSHNGIDKIQSATKNISEVVNRVKNLSTKIESLLSDDVSQDLKKLNGLFGVVPNDTLRLILENGLNYMDGNVSNGLHKIQDINHKVDGINFQVFPDIIAEVENFRWPSTIGLLCLLILLCLTLIWGVIKHSRCLLILFSVFGLLSVVVCWVLVSLYVGICVAGSDFCLDPEPFLYQQANGIVESGVLTYYIHCDEKIEDPFNKAISEGTSALKNVKLTLDQMNKTIDLAMSILQDKIQVIEETLNHLSDHISQTENLLDSIIDAVKCNNVNGEYRTALEAACTETFVWGSFINYILLQEKGEVSAKCATVIRGVEEGTAFMLVSAVGSGLLFTVLIWVASHTWIHIRKKPPTEHIDEEDPFLPPSSAMVNARRNRETNGHPGTHEDHNYLHGRYTPPPAYDQLSGGHLMGHVGSKMNYQA